MMHSLAAQKCRSYDTPDQRRRIRTRGLRLECTEGALSTFFTYLLGDGFVKKMKKRMCVVLTKSSYGWV